MDGSEVISQKLDSLFNSGAEMLTFTREQLQQILEDVVSEQITERDLENSTFLENLLNFLPDSVYFKDLDSQFIRVNKTFASTNDIEDPEDVVGKTDFDVFPYKTAIQKFADEQKIILNNEVIYAKEEQDELHDGTQRWMNTTKLPLYSRDQRVVGTFGISRDITDQKKAEFKLQLFAEELKRKNEQIESDLKMARKVQMAFLPDTYPSFTWDLSSNQSALQFFHKYIPSETLAGDFFQIIPISNSQAGIIVCDVMGHGVRASLVTAVLRGLVGEKKMITPYPHVFLRKVNNSLNTVLKQLDMMLFVTAFYGVVDLIKGEFRYANAGHPLPIKMSRSTGKTEYIPAVSENPEPALGLLDNFKYSNRVIPIEGGDSMLFYTDGIIEIESEAGEQFGYEKLKTMFDQPESESSEEIIEDLFTEIWDFAAEDIRNLDDMCAIAIDINRTA
jgi:sigma-B regulation protein RsbU (phosphoserine phosphatase)